MLSFIRPAVIMIALFTLVTGAAYPLAITGIAQAGLPSLANGDIISNGGAAVGSLLVGQLFTSDKYFHGRPSAAGANGYDASASSGSNLGPTSKKLLDRVVADVATLLQAGVEGIPSDAVTASASGLDPHISPAFAAVQVTRIATARGLEADAVRSLLKRHTSAPLVGIFGEPRVNVLELNLALDGEFKSRAK
jgi:potassium-transporting ATPase KdpC subunit